LLNNESTHTYSVLSRLQLAVHASIMSKVTVYLPINLYRQLNSQRPFI